MNKPQTMGSATPVSFFLDATPLLDDEWTGIPIVCAQIARCMIEAHCEVDFTLGSEMVSRSAVHDALNRHTGIFLRREIESGLLPKQSIAWPTQNISVGLSASVKRVRRYFDIECSIIHDISTVLQPHFHTPENVFWHTQAIVEDLKSNHITFCSSQATLDDLKLYMGEDESGLAIAYNAAEWPWWFAARSPGRSTARTDPYIVVLATREPRKNNAVVFQLLSERPELLERYRFVFVGKNGWLLNDTSLPDILKRAVDSERIIQSGYVSEYKKYLLLKEAELSIFPSIFEGFGLPILESISVDTPCVASFSSSMKEVGGGYCNYFDPYSSRSLSEALDQAILAKPCEDDLTKQRQWIDSFSWARTVNTMLAHIYSAIDSKFSSTDAFTNLNSVVD